MKLLDSKECHIKFGKYIREIRESKDIYQSEVAEKLGVSQVFISYIERGERDIDLALAFQLCDAVGTDMRDFINKCL